MMHATDDYSRSPLHRPSFVSRLFDQLYYYYSSCFTVITQPPIHHRRQSTKRRTSTCTSIMNQQQPAVSKRKVSSASSASTSSTTSPRRSLHPSMPMHRIVDTKFASSGENGSSPPTRSQLLDTRSASIVPTSTWMLSIMSASQALAVRRSWKHINTKALTTVVRRCYQKVESQCPSAAAAFGNACMLSTSGAAVRNIADHTKYLLALLNRSIADAIDVRAEMVELGAKHAPLKEQCCLKEQVVELFGEILIESFVHLDGIQESKEAVRGWRLLFATLIDRMRAGFEAECRANRRRSSCNDAVLLQQRQQQSSPSTSDRHHPRSTSAVTDNSRYVSSTLNANIDALAQSTISSAKHQSIAEKHQQGQQEQRQFDEQQHRPRSRSAIEVQGVVRRCSQT